MELPLRLIRFDPDSLSQSGRGSITGLICFVFGEDFFPAARWSDFVVVIVGWWITALKSNDRTLDLQFMDGPYRLRVTREADGQAVVECIESRRQELVTTTFRVGFLELRQQVAEVGRRILAACTERRWESEDLRTLASLLDPPTEHHP